MSSPAKSHTTRVQQRPAGSHETQMGFEEMVITRTKAWIQDYDDANLPRIAEAFTMTMRDRGDYYSYFAMRPNLSSQWRVIPGKGMVTFPIVGRSIKAKTATAVSTKIQTEVEAVRESIPEKAAAADLARNIARYCRDRNWTKDTEAAIAVLCQVGRFCFVFNDYKTAGGMVVEIPETQKRAVKNGDTVFTCSSCGMQYTPDQLGTDDIADQLKDKDLAQSDQLKTQPDEPHNVVNEDGTTDVHGDDEAAENETSGQASAGAPSQTSEQSTASDDAIDMEYNDGEYSVADDQASDPEEAKAVLQHTASLTCPDCGTNTLVMDQRARYESVDALTGNYLKRDCGFMDSRVVSPLLIRFDTYNCLGFDYKRAAWFNYHPLVPAYELLSVAPHLAEQLETSRSRWSEAARMHFELNNNTSSSMGYSYRQKNYRLDELVEVNVFWVAPHACFGFREPTGYKLPVFNFTESGDWVPDENNAQFEIHAGETIEDAFNRQFGEFRGMQVITWGDELVGIGNEHHTEKWTGVPWKIDPQSAYPQGEENLLKLQDAATNVLSMVYSHTKKRSMATLVADPMGGFTESAIKSVGQPGSTIIRQQVTAETGNRPWSEYLGYLEPGQMSGEVFNFVQMIIEIAKEESGVFNETVGNVENQETLGGRKMALNQSLSLMTPTQQAKALALVENVYIWLELWQKYAPDEAYTLIKGTYEEEWKPQDIEAFKALDIRRELAVTVVEGTDIPRTQREMEDRFLMAVNFGLFEEPNPLPLQIRNHIIKSVLGLDFDVGNYSAYERLAHRRYDVLGQEMEAVEPNEAFTILPDATGFPVRRLRPEIIASIMQDPRTMPRDTDEHLVFIEFYTDRINGLAGAKQPDEVMIAACEEMISAHRAYTAAKAAQANAIAGIAAQSGQPQMPDQPPGAQPPADGKQPSPNGPHQGLAPEQSSRPPQLGAM